jgi:hypothetical protein
LSLFTLFWLTCLLLVVRQAGAAPQAALSALTVRLEGEKVVVSFELDGAFTNELERSIESGLPTGFTYQMQLMRDRLRWADKKLISRSLQVDAMYNAIAREYLINTKLDGELVESRVVKDRQELAAAMTRIESFDAFSVAGLTGDRRCLVRVRAELGTRTLFFFIPTIRTTPWLESKKFHLPGSE